MRISLNQTKNTPSNSRNYQQPPINKQLHNIYKNRKKKKTYTPTKPNNCRKQNKTRTLHAANTATATAKICN
jgi:hypothetical protein